MAWRCSWICPSGPNYYRYACYTHGPFVDTTRDSPSPPLPFDYIGWRFLLNLWSTPFRGQRPYYQQVQGLRLRLAGGCGGKTTGWNGDCDLYIFGGSAQCPPALWTTSLRILHKRTMLHVPKPNDDFSHLIQCWLMRRNDWGLTCPLMTTWAASDMCISMRRTY